METLNNQIRFVSCRIRFLIGSFTPKNGIEYFYFLNLLNFSLLILQILLLEFVSLPH